MLEYVGKGQNYCMHGDDFIGWPSDSGHLNYTPNMIIKYNADTLVNHNFYWPGSAYQTEPTRYEDCGGFSSHTGPNKYFEMPSDAQPLQCKWTAHSDIEPDWGVRDMDYIVMPPSIPNGGYVYITYPRLTAESNSYGKADFTTYGSGSCEIVRYYNDGVGGGGDIALGFNNSVYTAMRNTYLPNLASDMKFYDLPAPAVTPTGGGLKEIENFYGPKISIYATKQYGSNRGLSLLKNVTAQAIHEESGRRTRNRVIENVNFAYSFNNIGSTDSYRTTMNGKINISTITTAGGFYNCDFGTTAATNIYIGGDRGVYVPTATANTSLFHNCTFGPYPVNVYMK